MNFFDIPEPPSYEYIQNKHMHKQEELLNEIRELQQIQIQLLSKMESDSGKESKLNTKRFWINFFIATIAAVAAVISAVVCIYPFVS